MSRGEERPVLLANTSPSDRSLSDPTYRPVSLTAARLSTQHPLSVPLELPEHVYDSGQMAPPGMGVSGYSLKGFSLARGARSRDPSLGGQGLRSLPHRLQSCLPAYQPQHYQRTLRIFTIPALHFPSTLSWKNASRERNLLRLEGKARVQMPAGELE